MLIPTVTSWVAATVRRVALWSALALLATAAGCKSPTTYEDPATLTLISGGNQTVAINPGGLADLPQPIVVRLERNGKRVGYGALSVQVASAAAPGTPRSYFYVTDAEGMATMHIQADEIPGPFNIDVTFWICSGPSLQTICSEAKTLATLRVTGTAVN